MKFDLLKSVEQNLFDLVKQDNPELKGNLDKFEISFAAEVETPVEGRTYFKLTAKDGGLYAEGDSATLSFTKQNLTAIADVFVGGQPTKVPFEATEESVLKLINDAIDPAIKDAVEVSVVKQDDVWVVAVEVIESLQPAVEKLGLSFELTEESPVMEDDVKEESLNGFDNEPNV